MLFAPYVKSFQNSFHLIRKSKPPTPHNTFQDLRQPSMLYPEQFFYTLKSETLQPYT